MVMHRPSTAATTAVLLLALAATPAVAGPAAPLDRARASLDRADGRAALAILEAALPDAPAADRPALLTALRRAYDLAARQAEAEGKAREARDYRENVAILNRKTAADREPRGAGDGSKAANPASAPRPAPGQSLASRPPREPAPAPKPPTETGPGPRPAPEPDPVSQPEALPAIGPPAVMPEPEQLPPPARREPDAPPARRPVDPPPTVESPTAATPTAEADAAFRAGRYDEAGKAYAALARAHRLPAGRRDHWAYCRMAAVVRRINAAPAGAAEWAELHAEIGRIRALSPKNWFGEYLRNLIAQRSGPARPGELVLRGASPEEPAAPAVRRRPAGPVKLARAEAPAAPAIPPAPDPAAPQIKWQVRQSANFCVFHADPALAERVAAVAEATREAQGKRWLGAARRPGWTPKCDLYLYPTAADFAKATGEPEESPGVTRMGQNHGRIISRQVHLRADHPNVATAILPHEVTHVVIGDLFPTKPPPRWADEGMAVLAEPAAEQRNRARDLVEPLKKGRVFRVEQLVALDCPDGPYWPLYYAQSVSLTRFLIDQGTPARFVQFLQDAERNGFEAELRRAYKIDGTNDLHKRWLAAAAAAAQPIDEAATAAAGESATRR